MDSGVIVNRSKLVLKKDSEDCFRAVSFNFPSREWILDDVGVWIHSVSNGIEEDQLIDTIRKQFPDLSNQQIESELADFYDSELLNKVRKGQSKKGTGASLADGSIGMLTVYFQDRSVEELKDEFLLWVFWNLTDLVFVVDTAQEADLIVCDSAVPEQKIEDKIYLQWDDECTDLDYERADLVFSAKECTSWLHEKWYRLVPDALNEEVPTKQVIEGMLDLGLRIERTAARLKQYLTGEKAAYYSGQCALEYIDSTLDAAPLLTIGMATFDDYDGV
ncbi:MAG: hypothetical protein ACI9FR_002729 [Cryomorphaceae bacterium]